MVGYAVWMAGMVWQRDGSVMNSIMMVEKIAGRCAMVWWKNGRMVIIIMMIIKITLIMIIIGDHEDRSPSARVRILPDGPK